MAKSHNAPLSPAKIAEIREAASDGCCLIDIVEATGHSKATVGKYAGDLLAKHLQAKRDARRATLRRLIAAVERGDDRDEIASRFGYKDARVLSVAASKARRTLGLGTATKHDSSKAGVVSDAQREAMREAAKTGSRTGDISRKFGRSRSTVHRHCSDIYGARSEARA